MLVSMFVASSVKYNKEVCENALYLPFVFVYLTVPSVSVKITDSSTGAILRGDVYVSQGMRHNFTCLASDTKPPGRIAWIFRGETVSPGIDEVSSQGASRFYNASSTITVPPLHGTHDNLTCTAAGAWNFTVSETITLMQLGKVFQVSCVVYMVTCLLYQDAV